MRKPELLLLLIVLLQMSCSSDGLLTYKGINYEVQALILVCGQLTVSTQVRERGGESIWWQLNYLIFMYFNIYIVVIQVQNKSGTSPKVAPKKEDLIGGGCKQKMS